MKYFQFFICLLITIPVIGQINISGIYDIVDYERTTKIVFIEGEQKSHLTSKTKYEGKSKAILNFFENGTVVTEGSILYNVITYDNGDIYEESDEINLNDEGFYYIEGYKLIISSGEFMTFKILPSTENKFTIVFKDNYEDDYGHKEISARIVCKKV